MENSKTILRAYGGAFKNYFKFSGRATRYDFWGFKLIDLAVTFVLSIFAALWNPISALSGLYGLATIFPSLSLTSRRLHDVGKSFWWFWLQLLLLVVTVACGAMNATAEEGSVVIAVLYIIVAFVTIIYSFYLLYLTCKKSSDNSKYGEPLKEDDAYVKRGKWFVVAYFAIIALLVLSVVGVAVYSQAMEKNKINKAADQVSMLQANIHELFAKSESYNGLSAPFAVEAGIVPQDMLGETQIINPFGGFVGVMGQENLFLIVYSDVPQEACEELSNQNWGESLVDLTYNFGEAKNCQECTKYGCELGWVFK